VFIFWSEQESAQNSAPDRQSQCPLQTYAFFVKLHEPPSSLNKPYTFIVKISIRILLFVKLTRLLLFVKWCVFSIKVHDPATIKAMIEEKIKDIKASYSREDGGVPVNDLRGPCTPAELAASLCATLKAHASYLALVENTDGSGNSFDLMLIAPTGIRFLLWTITVTNTDIIERSTIVPHEFADMADRIVIRHVRLISANYMFFAQRVVEQHYSNGATVSQLALIRKLFTPTYTVTDTVIVKDILIIATTLVEYTAKGGLDTEETRTGQETEDLVKRIHHDSKRAQYIGKFLDLKPITVTHTTKYGINPIGDTGEFDVMSTRTTIDKNQFALTPEAIADFTVNHVPDTVIIGYALFDCENTTHSGIIHPKKPIHCNLFSFLTNKEERASVNNAFATMIAGAMECDLAPALPAFSVEPLLAEGYDIAPRGTKRAADDEAGDEAGDEVVEHQDKRLRSGGALLDSDDDDDNESISVFGSDDEEH